MLAVRERYEALRGLVTEIPCFIIREALTGTGYQMVGLHTQADFEQVLLQLAGAQDPLNDPSSCSLGDGSKLPLLSSPGCIIRGYRGQKLLVQHALEKGCPSLHMQGRRGWWADQWPYTASDFYRLDEADDSDMYAKPRFTLHLDQPAADAITELYRTVFSKAPQSQFTVLDMCSSWISHFPTLETANARVSLMGLNEQELTANLVGYDFKVQDLNVNAEIPWAAEHFDFVTMLCSVDYLTQPREVFREIYRVLRPGGMAVIGFSNRYFANKVVAHWAQAGGEGTAVVEIVCNYFHFSENWYAIDSLDITPKSGADPMWVVTAIKPW